MEINNSELSMTIAIVLQYATFCDSCSFRYSLIRPLLQLSVFFITIERGESRSDVQLEQILLSLSYPIGHILNQCFRILFFFH